METITMTADQWAELRSTIRILSEFWGVSADGVPLYDLPADELRSLAYAANCYHADVNALLAAVDDANSRARYMALAADDQLGLF